MMSIGQPRPRYSWGLAATWIGPNGSARTALAPASRGRAIRAARTNRRMARAPWSRGAGNHEPRPLLEPDGVPAQDPSAELKRSRDDRREDHRLQHHQHHGLEAHVDQRLEGCLHADGGDG